MNFKKNKLLTPLPSSNPLLPRLLLLHPLICILFCDHAKLGDEFWTELHVGDEEEVEQLADENADVCFVDERINKVQGATSNGHIRVLEFVSEQKGNGYLERKGKPGEEGRKGER